MVSAAIVQTRPGAGSLRNAAGRPRIRSRYPPAMPQATLHDGSTIPIAIAGDGPAVVLPVRHEPYDETTAASMRAWGGDPDVGPTLIDGLASRFRVIAADYEGHRMANPAPDTLTPDALAADALAIAEPQAPGRSPGTATRGWRSPGSRSPCAPTACGRWRWAAIRHSTGRTPRCST